MRRLEQAGITILVVILIAVPTAIHGWPTTVAGNLFTAALLASGFTLVWWRHPRPVALLGGALWLVPGFLAEYGWFPESALMIMALLAVVAALGWHGRAAWLAALCLGAYVLVLRWAVDGTGVVALAMIAGPGFAAGTVLRQRQDAADELARRARELEQERELFTDLALHHERARIAAELHDIVGHAISVVVIQAAAGQRLLGNDSARAQQTFAVIADSARQGKRDLQRLLDLLGGAGTAAPGLSLIEEVVAGAARSGLAVSCRFEGNDGSTTAPAAHVAFRVVQESLTNALRHAPGAAVRVQVKRTSLGLTVSIENDRSVQERPGLSGTGRGLAGLRERLQELGGQLLAGPTATGGWRVEATLPT